MAESFRTAGEAANIAGCSKRGRLPARATRSASGQCKLADSAIQALPHASLSGGLRLPLASVRSKPSPENALAAAGWPVDNRARYHIKRLTFDGAVRYIARSLKSWAESAQLPARAVGRRGRLTRRLRRPPCPRLRSFLRCRCSAIPGQPGKDLCDRHLGVTRRDILRVGGSAMLGMSLGGMLQLQAAQAAATPASGSGPGWGKAKSVILVYLQGGPSHLDLWDPKENVPDNVKSVFKTIPSKVAGHGSHRDAAEARRGDRQVHVHPLDELHAGRPVQPHGRHLPDSHRLHGRQGQPVGPARAADAQGLPELRLATSSASSRRTVPMLPFVMMPRPLQESNVVNKAGTAGFLGRAYDPYYLFPPGDDMDMAKMDRIQRRRPEAAARSQRGPARPPRPPPRPDQRGHARDRQGRRQVRPRQVLRLGPQPDHVGPGPRGVRR